MNEESLSYLQKLEVTPGWRKEVVDLVREDLTFGLTKEQVQLYAQKDGSIERMRLYSDCLRKGYSEDIVGQLLDDTLDIFRCKVAVEFYELGIAIEKIVEVIQSTNNAKEMKNVFLEFLNKKQQLGSEPCDMPPYAKELISQIRSVVGQIKNHEEYYVELQKLVNGLAGAKQYEETIERLHKDISDREVQISAQQDEVNAGHKKVADQRNQIERLEKELEKMNETVSSLESKLQEKEEQVKELTNRLGNKNMNNAQAAYVAENGGYTPSENGIPVYYSVPMVERGKVVGRVQVENTKRRGDGSMGLLAKIAGIFVPDRDMVKKVIEANLSPAQLVQVRTGMEKGLTESQLYKLIDNDLSPETMQEIIDLAVLINKNK